MNWRSLEGRPVDVAIALCGCLIVPTEPGMFNLIPDPECPAHQDSPNPYEEES